MTSYVLDSSALLTLRNEEAGADQVETVLRKGQSGQGKIYISFISFTEIFYIVWQKRGKEEAFKVFLQLKMLPIKSVDPTEELLLLAGELKALYSVSLADSLIAATAIIKKATLIHKDPEFDALKDRLELLALPYKK